MGNGQPGRNAHRDEFSLRRKVEEREPVSGSPGNTRFNRRRLVSLYTCAGIERKKIANSPLSPFLDDKAGHGTKDAGELPPNRL